LGARKSEIVEVEVARLRLTIHTIHGFTDPCYHRRSAGGEPLAPSEYKHSLTFRVRRYVVTATEHEQRYPCTGCKCVQQCTTRGHPLPFPPGCIRVRAVAWECAEGQTDRHVHTQTRVTNIHFASSTTHAKCDDIMASLSITARLDGPFSRVLSTRYPCLRAVFTGREHG